MVRKKLHLQGCLYTLVTLYKSKGACLVVTLPCALLTYYSYQRFNYWTNFFNH
jgi:hypothetical protein